LSGRRTGGVQLEELRLKHDEKMRGKEKRIGQLVSMERYSRKQKSRLEGTRSGGRATSSRALGFQFRSQRALQLSKNRLYAHLHAPTLVTLNQWGVGALDRWGVRADGW
jgi:hypothetical protein